MTTSRAFGHWARFGLLGPASEVLAKFDCSFWLLMTVEPNCLISRVACFSHGWISCCLSACGRQSYCTLATRKSTSVTHNIPFLCKKLDRCFHYSVCLWCSGTIGWNNTFTHLVMFRWEMHVICVCDYCCGAVLLTIWGLLLRCSLYITVN